jgi:hypothetical protein
MRKLNGAPAVIIWIVALVAILTPPQIAAAGLAALVQAQEQIFDVLLDGPTSSIADQPVLR